MKLFKKLLILTMLFGFAFNVGVSGNHLGTPLVVYAEESDGDTEASDVEDNSEDDVIEIPGGNIKDPNVGDQHEVTEIPDIKNPELTGDEATAVGGWKDEVGDSRDARSLSLVRTSLMVVGVMVIFYSLIFLMVAVIDWGVPGFSLTKFVTFGKYEVTKDASLLAYGDNSNYISISKACIVFGMLFTLGCFIVTGLLFTVLRWVVDLIDSIR